MSMCAHRAGSCTRQVGSTMARYFSTAQELLIVALAHSKPNAAPRRPSAKSHAAFTKAPEMPPALCWTPKDTHNHAAIVNGSRCYSPISSAFSSLVASDCVAQAVLGMSSRLQLSRRTYAALQCSSPVRHQRSMHVLHDLTGARRC